MAEYIEREALLAELQEEIDFETPMYTTEQNEYFNRGLKCALRDVKRQSTADVVEVVRCKDCRWYDRGLCNCDQWWNDDRAVVIDDNDYCSYGWAKMDGKGEGE